MRSALQCTPAQRDQAAASGAVQNRRADRRILAKPTAESIGVAANLASTPRVAAQRKHLHAAFGRAIQRAADGEDELQMKASVDASGVAPGEGARVPPDSKGSAFERLARSVSDPGTLGLVSDMVGFASSQVAGAGVLQLVRWEDHGAKKFNNLWYFKDEGSARIALTAELGGSAATLKDSDWELGIRFAMDREEGADSALKLLYGTAEENARQAKIKARRDVVADAGLLAEINGGGFSVIATRALKLGLELYIEGNTNGSIGNSWTVQQVNDVIDELDGGEGYEVVGIQNPAQGDERKGIVIRDVHKATNKAAQGKGSVYRPSDTQANINMKVLGRLIQVHLNVG